MGLLSPIPWSKRLPEYFKQVKGYDLLEHLPALHNAAYENAYAIRYDLYDAIHKLFVESFLLWNGTPYEWQGLTVTAHFKDDLIIEYEIVDSFWRIKCMKNTGRM